MEDDSADEELEELAASMEPGNGDAGGGGEDDGDDGEEDEFVHVNANYYYLEYVIRFLGMVHAVISLCMLIAYYNLKIPLAIFKREKEVARRYNANVDLVQCSSPHHILILAHLPLSLSQTGVRRPVPRGAAGRRRHQGAVGQARHLGKVLPRQLLGQVRQEARAGEVQQAVRVRRHQQHPRHGEERAPAGGRRQVGARGALHEHRLALPTLEGWGHHDGKREKRDLPCCLLVHYIVKKSCVNILFNSSHSCTCCGTLSSPSSATTTTSSSRRISSTSR